MKYNQQETFNVGVKLVRSISVKKSYEVVQN